MSSFHSIILVFVVAMATFFTRATPFILFGRHKEVPQIVQYLGKILPPAIIGFLIVYCLKNVSFSNVSLFAPQFISVAVVVILHLWKRNNLLSIGIGTLLYMILIQLVFVLVK